ncbi:MAG: site-2 protease family protein [Phototrophicales bacterium]|nr:MAG: site-2 protease family protein [Phototrophicales bacterium]RMG70553.1 MAG: site-2 protease family protein [Chloroflexota bacterium]
MLLFGGDLLRYPGYILGVLVAVLIGMTVHEFAHNYVAYLMGDTTPKRDGRLTLDPRKHIYLPGFIMFVLIGFGILGLAPISAKRMRNPRWGYFAAVAAGPISNLLVAIIFGIIFRILEPTLASNFNLFLFMWALVSFNVLLFIFNLLPLFPLDGWHLVFTALPYEQARWWQQNAMITQYIFLGLILISFFPFLPFDPLGLIIREPLDVIMRILIG